MGTGVGARGCGGRGDSSGREGIGEGAREGLLVCQTAPLDAHPTHGRSLPAPCPTVCPHAPPHLHELIHKPLTLYRPQYIERLPHYIPHGQKSPNMRVRALIAVVAQHEHRPGGDHDLGA